MDTALIEECLDWLKERDSGQPRAGFDPVNLPAALELGRVSNLPTVWTNVLAGIVLSGGGGRPALIALSCWHR